MKRIFTIILVLLSCAGFGQFNNNWIDYNKTYYKFKVAATGLYRISHTSLTAAGLENVPMENLQLWRNGEQVTLFTTTNGTPGSGDYVEFWGEKNDGRPDKALYREARFQHSDRHSLYTDSVSFFLTVNTTGNNKRFTTLANDVSAPPIPKEAYFMHTVDTAYRARINPGYAARIGEYVYSSAYDQGEYWSSGEITVNATGLVRQFSNLSPYIAGPGATIRFGASGNQLNLRTVKAKLGTTEIFSKTMNFMQDSVFTIGNIPASSLSSGTASISIINASTASNDRMVVSFTSLTYPREFRFGDQMNFKFELPASPNGNYLEIKEFAHGGVAPVLYDLTNGTRYVVDIATAGTFKVMLAPSAVPRTLLMVGQQAANLREASTMVKRNFVNFFSTANQGNYIIISNPVLYNGNSGNPVEHYRDYRRSAQGGNYNAIVYNIDELEDQFAFGINRHPHSIKNFLSFARASFAVKPAYAFLIGRGVLYNLYYAQQANANAKKLNLVPTFGNPGSDNFLASEGTFLGVPETPIGRLSVIYPNEIEDYLEKVKEYELAQQTPSCNIADKAWMKNVMQVTGASDQYLGTVLCNYMNGYQSTLKDSLFGAKMHTFCKTTTGIGQDAAAQQITQLFEEGISMLNYFGHSSATILEFNINDPESYNNQGKYPVFLVNGCNAGGFFSYDIARINSLTTLTEKFNLAKQRGSIAFVASTHFGIVSYLNIYIDAIYKMMGKADYGNALGRIHKDAMQRIITIAGQDDYTARLHAEQITLHGDPAIKFNSFEKPDYAIEEQQVKVSPSFLSIAETGYNVDVKIFNLGNTSGDSLFVKVLRERPSGSRDTVYYGKIKPVAASDSLTLTVPIVATLDKGISKIIVELDPENIVDELCENNNQMTKEVIIYEDDARPVYPYPFAIVNKEVETFIASTSNPLGASLQYVIQVDTTELFNSALKVEQKISSSGGVLEFTPAIPMMDSVVYFWRTAVVPQDNADYRWSGASFRYIRASENGWGQSHYYQMKKNQAKDLLLGENGTMEFSTRPTEIRFTMGLYPHNTQASFLDDLNLTYSGCGNYLNSMVYMLFDRTTGKAIENKITSPSTGTYGSSYPVCAADGVNKKYLFYYPYTNAAGRKKGMDFLDSVANNTIVVLYNWTSSNPSYFFNTNFISHWKNDTLLYGGNSLYHTYKRMGINVVDSFTKNVSFIAILEKDKNGVYSVLDQDVSDTATTGFVMRYAFERKVSTGNFAAVNAGVSKNWKSVQWQSTLGNTDGDNAQFRLYGIRNDLSTDLLYTSAKAVQDTTLDFVDAAVYPRLKLELYQDEPLKGMARALKYWNIKYEEVPEGALSANTYFNMRDTVELGEKVNFGIVFKNISATDFDSLKLKVEIIDRNNITHNLAPQRVKPLISGDTVLVNPQIDTRDFPGANTVRLEVNPDNDQPEQHHFNNFLFRNLYVKPDETNPLLDVTFDGMHILNKDIVSSKPNISIKLKDEARFMPLSDTAAVTVTLRYMEQGGWTRTFKVDGDTLRFTPPSDPQTDNTALLEFLPHLLQDGEYELTVKGTDRSENSAGNLEYHLVFQTYNKPMISNMLNYPNPFTTSTAFVFTVTGSEIPQNIRIQILTVTGKIVREITKAELGPIRIGRNITEFKWDGTDQYGQKLANGVYLYRVLTNLNGKSLEKFSSESDKTDRFFTNGYGKMYLMR
ncbi:MAG: C25 family cysteine peptidase [Chitinophagaceae bacterium]